MGVMVVVSCILVFILMDVIVTTVIYLHGSQTAIFTEDGQNFDILHSVLDLWGTLLVRVCLLLGASIGVLWNRVDGPHRVSALGTLTLLICLTISTYALAKLLILSEQGDLAHQPWFLSLFSWTCVSALGTVLLWRLLGRTPNTVTEGEGGGGGGGGHGGSEETERLVETAGENGTEEVEEQGQEHGGKRRRASRKGTQDQTDSGATMGRLLSYCSKDAGLLSVAVLFLLISAVCEAFIPYYIGQAIDGVVIHKSMEYFTKPLITLTVLALASSIAVGVRGGLFSLTFARLNLRLRNLLFRSLMRQEIGFFDANHTGDITSRLSSDTTQVSDLISLNINMFLKSMVKGIGFFIFMFGISWKLTLVTIMGFPFIAVISKVYGEYYKRLTKEVQTALAQANQVAEETISAMKTVRSFANEEQEADSYYGRLQVMFQLNKKQALAYALYMWSSCISELVLEVAILFYGGHLVVTEQMSGGGLISFILYELELGECLESIASVYTGLMQGVGAAEKVFEYMDRESKHPHDGKEVPDTCKGLVEFKDVTFSYPTRPETEILKSVSFTLRPGEVTALVGPSGSGKSSCVGLLENFYPPQQGQVLLDGRQVHTYQHDLLHSQVALVGQEPVLFARSVEQNITYGLTDIPMEAVVQAATKANAHDFITGLTNGYDTGVGEKGTQLSGGQKQRVAIARALIRNPHVLILDEATSALDAESEHVVQQALNNKMRQHTVLLIAHRLSTVEKANNIIVINHGCVVEQGPHNQLMAKGGLYCKLVQRQVLGIETGAEVLNTPEKHSWKSEGGSQRSGPDSSSPSKSECEAPCY
ncbi:ABC-type oligopeptide transporter ABCB9-like [Oncorhynchus nerka]|uniref:ABC-type oligopeptide transporter ABCB9-like n=1 Tax=Oncorhynchus nerka TaxID=8023 RepID=UPI0011322BD7|nr:ATP-binding cassette sub-family B member 9-like [Oncorhynchus nerka]